ncbi:hypothetical protein ACFPM0_27280 [Pseudonocardia sulfidoxydans]|uniref:hypothetical protein n=1 Tax=Pseudonocardia sulfidoxydans TaxID=54011 RepID=UPI0036235CC7
MSRSRHRPVWRDARSVLLLDHTPEGWRTAPRYLVHTHPAERRELRERTKAQVD